MFPVGSTARSGTTLTAVVASLGGPFDWLHWG